VFVCNFDVDQTDEFEPYLGEVSRVAMEVAKKERA